MSAALPRTRRELARRIDHTLLRPEARAEDVDRLCDECLTHDFFAACVNPVWLERAVNRLDGGATSVAGVVGFPLGASLPQTKADEARQCAEQGAHELDMVVNIAALLAGDAACVTADIAGVVAAAWRVDERILVKVILETGLLSEAQLALGCRCAADAGAHFVKTSTGFHSCGGATVEAVSLLRKHAGGLRVKASGGIRDVGTAVAMLEAGADRLGMSASVAVVEAFAPRG